jgi:glycosyltransferase involved in cell wall biosynthesis
VMILLPNYFFQVLNKDFDVVHVVLPLNLSGMWLLAAFKAVRTFRNQTKPSLVVSWHCNMVDYVVHHSPPGLLWLTRLILFKGLFAVLPLISDRILTPTKSTDPEIVQQWEGRAGVCFTGIEMGSFSPGNKNSEWGSTWSRRKEAYLKETNCEFLIVCVGRLSPEKGTDELIRTLSLLPGCALWLVGDGPARPSLELLASECKANVKFLGYQKGDALHAVYAVGDLFVCPSLTETFGQTVNEALASQVRVALPNVAVFAEAYSHVVPKDAFWKPLDRSAMACAIMKQLERHRNGDEFGIPDLSKLMTWDEACLDLITEYKKASTGQRGLPVSAAITFPLWYLVTIFTSLSIFYLSFVRTLFGGSVRVYFSMVPSRIENKMKDLKKDLQEKILEVER